ncbi:hypothetical protein NCCP2222_21640 [Sporosarcina sp. NCCP-2222]|nr:hypothetical protein NCCP2222_21640 [Sporosarcina sp. NCCP-2222]
MKKGLLYFLTGSVDREKIIINIAFGDTIHMWIVSPFLLLYQRLYDLYRRTGTSIRTRINTGTEFVCRKLEGRRRIYVKI